MREGLGGRAAEPAALLDGVVRQRVVHDQVVLAAEVAHERHVGGVPADQHQRVLGVLPVGDFLLQLLVQLLFARQQAAAAGAGAVFVDRVLGGFHHLGSAAHARVVVGAEVEHLVPVHDAGVPQRGFVADEVGVVSAQSAQAFDALLKGDVLGRVLKPFDGLYRLVRLALAFVCGLRR